MSNHPELVIGGRTRTDPAVDGVRVEARERIVIELAAFLGKAKPEARRRQEINRASMNAT
jgi:hypothetical protein